MNIINLKTINSTNTYVKENIDSLSDKDIVAAEKQTEGRGRLKRVWTDLGAENVYMTICLKPSDVIKPVYSNLTQYLSICTCRELEELGLKPQIKWPNDMLINGKKVAGILAEAVVRGGKLKGIALGIGVNLNASRIDLSQIDRPATSINLELEQNIDKKEFTQKLLERFFAGYDEFLELGFSSIKKDYEKRALSFFKDHCPPLEGGPKSIDFEGGKKSLKIAIFDKIKEGEFAGFDKSGAILLIDKTNKIQSINMGEII